MKRYCLYCYNNRNKLVYTIKLCMREETFEKQIKGGYIRFFDKDHGETICYLNMYNKIIIETY